MSPRQHPLSQWAVAVLTVCQCGVRWAGGTSPRRLADSTAAWLERRRNGRTPTGPRGPAPGAVAGHTRFMIHNVLRPMHRVDGEDGGRHAAPSDANATAVSQTGIEITAPMMEGLSKAAAGRGMT